MDARRAPPLDRLGLLLYGAAVVLLTGRHEIALFVVAIGTALMVAGGAAGRLLRRACLLLALMNGAASAGYAMVAAAHGNFDAAVLVRLNLRTLAITLLTLAVVRRINLAAAVAPFPTLSFLLTLCLGQIVSLRRAADDLRLAWTSRTPVRPRPTTARRQAAAATEALLRRAQSRAHATGEAMRSRGLFDG